ncbi:hypothetical protein RI103_08135 [Paraburkholderia sp. FT54]|uniref:hypothetical protein n=1 Tax=Paraburkholderia sp. FT54 TaxID=3074437 RepID=UPI002877A007|nr:hypothetical protein [Paraburkholderia sp. FT54]WNC91300.1 hypothetical protein RI103_08135 [Paraburkholderia sp. FT54]
MAERKVALGRAVDAAQHLLDPVPPWEDVLDTARDLVGADSGTLIVFDNQCRLLNLTAVGFTESCSRDYNSYFYSHDILEHDSRSAPAGTWLDTGQMYSNWSCTPFRGHLVRGWSTSDHSAEALRMRMR